MSWFKKEKKIISESIQFIKRTHIIKGGGYETWYHTKIGNRYVKSSVSNNKEVAKAYFESVIANKGELSTEEVLIEKKVHKTTEL